jgi:hypothetical protein
MTELEEIKIEIEENKETTSFKEMKRCYLFQNELTEKTRQQNLFLFYIFLLMIYMGVNIGLLSGN